MSSTRREDWPVLRLMHETGDENLAMAMDAPLFLFTDNADVSAAADEIDGRGDWPGGLHLPFEAVCVVSGDPWPDLAHAVYARHSAGKLMVDVYEVRPKARRLYAFDFATYEHGVMLIHPDWRHGAETLPGWSPLPGEDEWDPPDQPWGEREWAAVGETVRRDLDVEERFARHFLLDAVRACRVSARSHVAEARPREHNDRGKTRWKAPWCLTSLPRAVVLDGDRAPTDARSGGTSFAPTDREVRPHRRRGHYKTLRSERFKHKRGERVWVRPAWVGPREWVLGGTTYRVVTT